MKYKVLDSFRAITSQGGMELPKGQIITLPKDTAIKLLNEKKIMPILEVMGQEYQSLADWLHQFDLTSDEIKETLPGLYQDIQTTIERLDSTFYAEDPTAFQGALERIRSLYAEALIRCGRRVC